MTTLFISDLHVDEAHPEIARQLYAFLATEAREAEALYILGDLFESWIGDDDPDVVKRGVVAALRATVAAGTPCFFMRGNRDFLIGEEFARASGCTLLDDPAPVELYGEPVLLMHGDTLCTDDTDYQEFRRMVRDPQWQAAFLAQGLAQRLAQARAARDASRARTSRLSEEIMDVNAGAVQAALRGSDARILLHGHTHRPAVHRFDAGGRAATRIVLGDWYTQGSVLRWDAGGFALETLPR
ncbi:MAG TPA: UDP-2,3-diacylglucosamine diphosphatase [Gammaproteobacteria bacterium]|nr:UDP-2,3-diacylglucosamine diphosphatase [Gammaproteobacteria bacterium]